MRPAGEVRSEGGAEEEEEDVGPLWGVGTADPHILRPRPSLPSSVPDIPSASSSRQKRQEVFCRFSIIPQTTSPLPLCELFPALLADTYIL